MVVLSLVFEFWHTYALYYLHTLSEGIYTSSDGAAAESSALGICYSGVSRKYQPANRGNRLCYAEHNGAEAA